MITVGIVSLVFGCVFLYIYQTQIKGGGPNKLTNAAKLSALQKENQDPQSTELSIENVRWGGIIHLDDVGLRSESFDAQITARHLHKSGSERWVELEADRGESNVFLTLQRDDALTVSLTIAQPSLETLDLKYGDLDTLSGAKQLTYEGTAYTASEHGYAIFCRDHNELKPQEYEYWEFEDEEEEQFLTLVRWEDGTVEANYSVDLNPRHITVYSRS